MKRFYARLCWNSDGWRAPTREVKDLKLERKSYALSQGFGHEEWLFDFTNAVDGYQYGFLQPLNKGRSLEGKTINVLLYTLTPNAERVLVAEIAHAEVLSEEQRRYAFKANEENGRIARMREELKKLDVNPNPLDIDDLFNIRFKRYNVIFQDAPYRELAPRSHFKTLKRYSMFPALPGALRFERPPAVPNQSTLPESRIHLRPAIQSVIVQDRHLQLQRALRDLLNEYYGDQHVTVEKGGLDLAVRKGSRRILIEIKSGSVIKFVFREAVGQIIEYAHWPTRFDEFNELVIVSPAAETEDSRKYLDSLRRRYKLPIAYCSFAVGESLPEGLQ